MLFTQRQKQRNTRIQSILEEQVIGNQDMDHTAGDLCKTEI